MTKKKKKDDKSVVFLDSQKQDIVDSIEGFKQRVIKGSVSDFIIIGVNAKSNGYFSLHNIGEDVEKIAFGLTLTHQHIVDTVMSIADVYMGDEVGDYNSSEERNNEDEAEYDEEEDDEFSGEDNTIEFTFWEEEKDSPKE